MLLLIAALLAPGWMADDLPGALEAARSQDKPVVVDLWAPWCHTCLSMKQTVLQDPKIRARRGDFIWVALDTDRPVNAAAVKRLKPAAWPTFYRLAPDGTVVARHAGAATVDEFLAFLGAPTQAADAAAAAGRFAEAEAGYAKAIAAAPGSADAVRWRVARIGLLRKLGRHRDCAAFGLEHLAAIGRNRSAAAADFTWYTHDCAGKTKDVAFAKTTRAALIAPGAPLPAILAQPDRLSADDHSDALRILREIQHALGDKAAAKATAAQQWAVIQAAWRATSKPRHRMTFNWPLVEVAVFLGKHADALPLVSANADALPGEYDPAYRLAWLLHQMGDSDRAIAPIARARRLVYGPRTARVAQLQVDIHRAVRDIPGALDAARAVLAVHGHDPTSAAFKRAAKQVADLEAIPPLP